MSEARTKRVSYCLLLAAIVLGSVSQLNAERIFFANGRTMSVQNHQIVDDVMVVTLKHGGQARFDRAIVDRVEPDEIAEAAAEPTAAEPQAAEGQAAEPQAPPAAPSLSGRPFAELIESVALRHGVDPALVHAVVEAESNYQPRARSQMGARGLMQVMPRTALAFGIRNLYDPQANLEAGVQYLKFLLTRFNLIQAIAAYNAGPEAVKKYRGVPPFPETRKYVRKVLANFQR